MGRYLIEMGSGARIRRLVTLGSPYYGRSFPGRELAIFAAGDLLISPPDAGRSARILVVPGCGHLGLLHCPTVHQRIADYLNGRARGVGLLRSVARRAAA